MQPVVDLTCPLMDRIYDISLVPLLATMMIYIRDCIQQSMMMRYYKFWEENFISLKPEWIDHFEELIQVAWVKIDQYTPRDGMMYNEGKDSGCNNGYNQELTEGHDDRWDEAKEYYQKIFERELSKAKDN